MPLLQLNTTYIARRVCFWGISRVAIYSSSLLQLPLPHCLYSYYTFGLRAFSCVRCVPSDLLSLHVLDCQSSAFLAGIQLQARNTHLAISRAGASQALWFLFHLAFPSVFDIYTFMSQYSPVSVDHQVGQSNYFILYEIILEFLSKFIWVTWSRRVLRPSLWVANLRNMPEIRLLPYIVQPRI